MDIEKKKKKICSCHEKCSYCIVTSFSIESATVIAYLSEKISISNGALVITSARHCDQAPPPCCFVMLSCTIIFITIEGNIGEGSWYFRPSPRGGSGNFILIARQGHIIFNAQFKIYIPSPSCPANFPANFLPRYFAVSRKTTTSNDQIVGFVENVNTRQPIFLTLFELESRHYEFGSWTIQSHQTNSTNWNNCKVISKGANSFFFFSMTLSLLVVVVPKAPYCLH